ncbi:MAG: hypothetical protein AABW72_01345 [archaeon]
MSKSIISSKLFFVFLLLLILPSIFSLSVSIQPKNGSSPAAVYQYEVTDYVIKVRNDADAEITDVGLKVSVGPELKIVEGYDELEYKIFKLPVMGPKELREEEIKIKPIINAEDAEGKKLQITVDYGISSLTDYSGTYLLSIEPSLLVDSKLSSEKVTAGEDASITITASNNSDYDISDIKFELMGNEDFYLKETSFLNVALLKKNEKIEEKQLEFKLVISKKEQRLILNASFVDSVGYHLLQKNFAIKEQPKTMTFVYVLIAVVLVLIVFTLMKILKGKKASSLHDSHAEHAQVGHSGSNHQKHVHELPEESEDSGEDSEDEELSEEDESDLGEEELAEEESDEDFEGEDEESEPDSEEKQGHAGKHH